MLILFVERTVSRGGSRLPEEELHTSKLKWINLLQLCAQLQEQRFNSLAKSQRVSFEFICSLSEKVSSL